MIMLTQTEVDRINSLKLLDPELATKMDLALIELCKRRLVHLRIFNAFPGYWYGRLTRNGLGIDVTRKLTAKEVSSLNQLDFGCGWKAYKEGDSSCRFFSRESLINAACASLTDELLVISK